LKYTAFAANVARSKGAEVAKDSTPKKAEDLEVAPDKADEVKGGRVPTEPGGSTTRSLSVKKHKSGKKPVHYSGGKHY
jgi:hypothetical protein